LAVVKEMRLRGARVVDVAERFGVHPNTVTRVLRGIRVCDGGPGEHASRARPT
jgi:transposase-like protein